MTTDIDHILKLAEIIREVDGNHSLGAAVLAEAILSHPGSRWSPAVEPVPDTKERELLNLLLDDLDALIDSSEGVAGLHLNGDIACWESLRQGGRFETWLMRMDEARAFLDSTMDKPAGARPATREGD